jgi:hypothetical protein
MSGLVIMLDTLKREEIEMIPMEACNGTMYKIGTILLPGKYVKATEQID